MKQALFVLEWRRLAASFVLSLALGLAVIGAIAFFLISSVRQQQTHEAIRAQMAAKQTALHQANGSWIYVANHPNETNPVSVAQAKQKVLHANQLTRLYEQQREAFSQGDNRNYLKTSLRVFDQEKILKTLTPDDFSADLIANQHQASLFRKLLTTHQGYEINGSSTLPAVFLTDFSSLLSHWSVILLMVMILSTTWTLSWFGKQHEWVMLNQPNSWIWLGMNFLVALLTWFVMLGIALSLSLLISKIWGQPFINGHHGWQNNATNVAQSLNVLFQENLLESVVRFGLIYFIWQILCLFAARIRR